MAYEDLVEELATALLEEPSVGAATYWADRKARAARKAAMTANYKARLESDPEFRAEQDKRESEFRAYQDAQHKNDIVDTRGDW